MITVKIKDEIIPYVAYSFRFSAYPGIIGFKLLSTEQNLDRYKQWQDMNNKGGNKIHLSGRYETTAYNRMMVEEKDPLEIDMSGEFEVSFVRVSRFQQMLNSINRIIQRLTGR